MWVDAAMAARSILCSAGAIASDSAAAPALPKPASAFRAAHMPAHARVVSGMVAKQA